MPKKLPKDSMFFGMGHTLTDEQKEYIDYILSEDIDIIFCNAPAGTGKTTLAVGGAKLLHGTKHKGNTLDGMLYIFAPVEENKMGFRPGDQYEKEIEYTSPLREALAKIGEQPDKAIIYHDVADAKKKGSTGWVETSSHVFKRGTNVENKIVIIDEAQNWTLDQLKKMLTRIHDSCKVIVIGHTGQCDLPNASMSGFEQYIHWFAQEERARVCHLTINFRGWIARHADAIQRK